MSLLSNYQLLSDPQFGIMMVIHRTKTYHKAINVKLDEGGI